MSDRTGAHRARLQRDPQVAPVQSGGAETGRSRADRDHLGVSSRIVAGAHRIGSRRNDHAFSRDHGSDRDFARGGSLARQIKGVAHGFGEGKGHKGRLAGAAAARQTGW